MITDISEVEHGASLSADVCIIGSGAAGITIAREFIGTPIAVKILEGEFREGDQVKIDAAGDALIFSHGESTASDERWAERTLH